jgi:hypothetical protein
MNIIQICMHVWRHFTEKKYLANIKSTFGGMLK